MEEQLERRRIDYSSKKLNFKYFIVAFQLVLAPNVQPEEQVQLQDIHCVTLNVSLAGFPGNYSATRFDLFTTF